MFILMKPATAARIVDEYKKALGRLRLTPNQTFRAMRSSPQISKPVFELIYRSTAPEGDSTRADQIERTYQALSQKIQTGQDLERALIAESEPNEEELAETLKCLRSLPAAIGKALRDTPKKLHLPRWHGPGRSQALSKSDRKDALEYVFRQVSRGEKPFTVAREWCDQHPGKAHPTTIVTYFKQEREVASEVRSARSVAPRPR